MKLKKLLVILAIVLFLFALVFVKKSIQHREGRKEAAQNELAAGFELVREIPEAFLSKIVIYKGSNEKDRLVLAKDKDESWIIESKYGVKAKREVIDGLLKELRGLNGEVRGESKELFPDFQIEDEKAVHIILEGPEGKALKHLAISFLTPAWDKNFVRDADSPKVFLVDKNILVKLNIFGKDDNLRAMSFADLKLLTFDSQGVSNITLESQGKDKNTLKKNQPEKGGNSVWSFEPSIENEEIDQAKVDGFLQNINSIYANDVMDPSLKTYGLENPLFRLDLADSAGKKVVQIDVGSYIEPEKAYYIKSSSSNSIFKVPESYMTSLKEGKKSFIKPPQAPAPKKP